MLVTLNEVKDYLGIPLTNTTYDAFLTSQISLLTDAIRAYCRRRFNAANFTQVFYKNDFDAFDATESRIYVFEYPVLLLPTAPVVKIDGEVLDPTEYVIQTEFGAFTRKKSKWFTGEEIEITYRAGYDVIPSPIKDVCFSVVAQRYNRKKSGIALDFGPDVKSISIPGTVAVDFDYSLAADDRKNPFGSLLSGHLNVLDYYRSERAIKGSGTITYVG